jgi:hypothetical protein
VHGQRLAHRDDDLHPHQDLDGDLLSPRPRR